MSLLLYMIGMLALAYSEAQEDYEAIKGGDTIRHTQGWIFRGCLALCFASLIVHFGDHPIWKLVPMLIGGGFLFASVHRLLLNKWRGKRWRYISKSSAYDRFWISTSAAERFAGCNAFLFEALVFAASITITLI